MTDLPVSQYADDTNLRARQRLWEHQDPAFDVVLWAISLAGVAPGARVLDLGCGNGRYLRALADVGAEPVGVDVSAGMLAAAPRFARVAADAVRLPFPAACFDTVMAPHMLYHVADRVTAARELRRVLRPGGTCVAVTNGAGHLASLRRLVEDAVASASPGWRWRDRLGEAFSLENGADQLAVAFSRVACERPASAGRAVITDAEVVAGYLASMADLYGPQTPLPWEQVVEAVHELVGRRIASEGRFVVEGDVGAIVAR